MEKNIGCIGSTNYENKLLIKNTIFGLSMDNDKRLTNIYTRGNVKKGSEFYVKKYSLEFNLNYLEIPSACDIHTNYSIYGSNFYNKTWNFKYFIQQAMIFVGKIDVLCVFGNPNDDKRISLFIKQASKMNKPIIYVS